MTVQTISLTRAVFCCTCKTVSDVTHDQCPACGENGTLLSLARILNPDKKRGQVMRIA